MNKWVIELPHLENSIDLNGLMKNYPWDKGTNDPWRGVSCYEVTYEQKEICDFMNKYNDSIHFSRPPSYWLTHKAKDAWISPHTDQTREAVLLFPFIPKTHTINFLENVDDSKSVIFSHEYIYPSIPNAKIPHCVFDMGVERYFLQISLYIKDYTWDNLVEWISKGEIFAR
jgi:hypothetical protein